MLWGLSPGLVAQDASADATAFTCSVRSFGHATFFSATIVVGVSSSSPVSSATCVLVPLPAGF